MKNLKNIKFNAAILFKLKKKLQFKNLELKKLSKGQVLVKIIYSSICRSQIMEIDGHRNNKNYLPHLLGHEGFGIVVDVAKDVKGFKKNDEVIIGWIKNNNKNYKGFKIRANPNGLKINSGCITTFSNFSLISENRLTKKPKKMRPIEASFYGCAVPTGSGMIINQLKPKKNEKILLIGLGAVGICALATLKALKIKNVSIIEPNSKRSDIAKKLGFKEIFNPKNKKMINIIRQKYPNGFDSCIESAGHTKTIELGFSLINQKHGKLIFASHPSNDKKISLNPHDLIKGKRLIGSWGGNCLPTRDIPKIFELFKRNDINLSKFFNKVYSFKNINNAILDFKKGKAIRPLIKMKH
jgi:Zn-dependent alcohol dehydrogenase